MSGLRRVVMTKRSWLSLGSAAVCAALLWSSYAALMFRSSGGQQQRNGSAATGTAQSADAVSAANGEDTDVNIPGQCLGVAVVTPSYLPIGVLSVPDISCGAHNVLMVFRLVGAANSDTFPASGAATEFDGSQHPASVLSFAETDGPANSLPDGIDPEFFAVRDITLTNGALARVTTPLSGYGPHRIDWLMGNKLFTLLGTRGSTNEGDSGLPMDELIKIADSVPSPQV